MKEDVIMKKKAALLLVTLALGAIMAACGQSGTSVPVPTVPPTATPEATEEPAEPTATPEAESTADDDEPATHEELVEMITEKLGYTEEEAEDLIQEVVEWDEADQASLDTVKAARNEEFIQDYMEFGFTREEAEAKCEEIERRGTAARIEEGVRMRISHIQESKRIEEDAQRVKEEADSYYMERYGITQDQAMGMSPDELRELRIQKHGG